MYCHGVWHGKLNSYHRLGDPLFLPAAQQEPCRGSTVKREQGRNQKLIPTLRRGLTERRVKLAVYVKKALRKGS